MLTELTIKGFVPGDQVRSNAKGQVGDLAWSQVWFLVCNQVRVPVEDQIWEHIWYQLEKDILDAN